MQQKPTNSSIPLKAIDRIEIFKRNGMYCQVMVAPVAFSFPANRYKTALDSPIGLNSLGRALRDVPQFASHQVDVSPFYLAGSWAAAEQDNGLSSMTLARTGDWTVVDLWNGDIDAADLTVLDRRIAVRYLVFRLIGNHPIEVGDIALPNYIHVRMLQMIKFAIMSTAGSVEDALASNKVAVEVFPIQPFVSGMLGFNAIRTRAILDHVAHASSTGSGADGSISYEVVKDDDGVNRVCLKGVRSPAGTYTVCVMMGDDLRGYFELLHPTLDHSRALLAQLASRHGLELISPTDAARLH